MAEKVVVTGGAGFIGSHLVAALREKNYEPVAVDLKVGSDILKPDDLTRAFEGAKYVFHLAALPRVQFSIDQPREANETNITGTLAVLHAAAQAKVQRVVYSASSSCYGDQDTLPIVETMEVRPKSPYALQKYVGELYCRMWSEIYGLPTVSLRYFNVYGPGADPNGPYAQVIPKFIQMRLNGEPMTITGDGEQTRDLVHVRDVVQANIKAAQSPKVGKGECINIGTGKSASINRIAELIGGPTTYIPARLEPHDTRADTRLAKELLDWEPTTTLEEGIEELKRLSNLP